MRADDHRTCAAVQNERQYPLGHNSITSRRSALPHRWPLPELALLAALLWSASAQTNIDVEADIDAGVLESICRAAAAETFRPTQARPSTFFAFVQTNRSMKRMSCDAPVAVTRRPHDLPGRTSDRHATAPARQPSKSPPIEARGPWNCVDFCARTFLGHLTARPACFQRRHGRWIERPLSIGSIRILWLGACATAELAAAIKMTEQQTTAPHQSPIHGSDRPLAVSSAPARGARVDV